MYFFFNICSLDENLSGGAVGCPQLVLEYGYQIKRIHLSLKNTTYHKSRPRDFLLACSLENKRWDAPRLIIDRETCPLRLSVPLPFRQSNNSIGTLHYDTAGLG